MKIALVGAECEENLALRYIRAALEEGGHGVTQITFNAEADTEMAAECLARSGAGLAGFVPYWAELHSEGAKARKSVSPLLQIAQPSACRPARGYRYT
jgi:hypothetical protein